ncbi:MAG: leucine-rich repeat domain-containing protein [Ruminococcus sp.]|nr:leucine-rich repeat domain-containing protein [Ruminococcus sp.]
MKKTIAVLLAALMLLSILSVVSASAIKQLALTGKVGDCKWTYYNDLKELRVTDGTEIMSDENNKYPWSSWDNIGQVKKIVIGNGIKNIGPSAFENFSSVTSVELPDTLENIYYCAFDSCKSLKSITFPNSLKAIANHAFACCGLKSVKIPKSVTRILFCAFISCYDLSEVIFPDGISATVGNSAFYNTNLKSVYLPAGITQIDELAFGYYSTDGYTDTSVNGFTIITPKNTVAEAYAKANGFKLKNAVAIRDWKVTGIKNLTYTGKPLKQSNILVSKSGEYADFTVKYKNNLNVGTATVTLTGEGDYYGTITKTFKISKAKNPMTVVCKKTVTANSKKKTTIKKAVTAKNPQGAVSYKTNNKKVTVKKGTMTVAKGLKKGKTYTVKVTVTAKGNKNYKSGSRTVNVKIQVK